VNRDERERRSHLSERYEKTAPRPQDPGGQSPVPGEGRGVSRGDPAEEWPTRYRDLEFTLTEEDTRDAITERWDKAWNGLYKTLDGLTAEDLLGTMTVRGNDSTLMEVLNGQYRHYAVHVGQIVFLAKHFRVTNWDSLSVPKKR